MQTQNPNHRVRITILFLLIASLFTEIYAKDDKQNEYKKQELKIPMNDGILLATDVYLPGSKPLFPVVLVRTPYDKNGVKGSVEKFIKNGVAVVAQDCRGRLKSEGDFYPFINDWIKHENYDEYWKTMDFKGITKAPLLSVAGWQDIFLKQQIDDFQKLLQNKNINRKDQLIFETEVLTKSLTLLGDISAELFVLSDAECTDFIICVQDVFPDGNIINIQEGGARISFSGIMPEKHKISVWATGYEIKSGHKLRVVITSGWFPRYNRSLNTCEPAFSSTKMKSAHQTVYFGGETPSHIVFPVLNEKKEY